jgi:shikimate 5-dehydrogenase
MGKPIFGNLMAHPDRFLPADAMGWPVMHSRSPLLHDYLLHQSRPAWNAWFGIEPEVTPELRALVEQTI